MKHPVSKIIQDDKKENNNNALVGMKLGKRERSRMNPFQRIVVIICNIDARSSQTCLGD